MLILIQQIILLLGTLISGIVDAKTGYIYDKITYPMIIIGLILSLAQFQWFNIISGVAIFVLLFLIYKIGGIGGGDVKLFTAIALLNPFNEINFLISLILFASITSILFYSIYYTLKYTLIFGIRKLDGNDIMRGIIFLVFLIIYFYFIYSTGIINELFLMFFLVPFIFASFYIMVQKELSKKFFEKKIKLNKISEDEIISNNNSEKIIKLLKGKKLIGEKEIKLLKKNKINEVIIMDNLPKFGPFIFIGTIFAIFFPNIIFLIF